MIGRIGKRSHTDHSLTPSERNELKEARRTVKNRNRTENEEMMALFQMIYLRIDRSLETFSQVVAKK